MKGGSITSEKHLTRALFTIRAAIQTYIQMTMMIRTTIMADKYIIGGGREGERNQGWLWSFSSQSKWWREDRVSATSFTLSIPILPESEIKQEIHSALTTSNAARGWVWSVAEMVGEDMAEREEPATRTFRERWSMISCLKIVFQLWTSPETST